MANPRVHEIAAELGIESNIALEKLKEMGEYVKSASSSIAPPVARRLKQQLEATLGSAYKVSITHATDVAKKVISIPTPFFEPRDGSGLQLYDVDVHFPDIKKRLVEEALRIFFEVREVPGLKKKPSTSELLDWLKLLLNEDITPEMLRERDLRKLIPPLHGALLKNEQDVHLFERLAFLSRREV